ncbi:Cof-type HAD-IIB family hydrolase [Clostridium oryzae]|uniref:Putative phosphatase YwpJ n=1 Tax=Clostridium oryzae TaxID=1450648 RepID=A0A1V4IGJ8_9CLOT|nr:Cof-type HAD-IIB family hydrolase [Clostridium oryzae]OPJ59112.1 putative phosphatase YwpJ [Clostridium oryzae]
MQYKLICIDMDGTLLNKYKRVSEASKEAIKKAFDKGIHIVITTGRTYVDAKYYSDLIGVKSPVIASNGALIKEKDRNEIIYKGVFKEGICPKLIDILSKYNVLIMFITPEKVYYENNFVKAVMPYLQLLRIVNPKIVYENIENREQWGKVFDFEQDNIIKCEIMSKNQRKLSEIRTKLNYVEGIEVVSSAKHNIEINNKGVCKGKAVEVLSGFYNIDRKEIIAIGDSENDLSMLEYAGIGVAMGNSTENIKQKADYVTDTNNNDGVAKAIDKFVLTNKN